MEFTLDFSFIRDILKQEHARARDEIRDLGVLRALESSQQRHDARIAAAPDVGTLACRAGCTWCCYFTVDALSATIENQICRFSAETIELCVRWYITYRLSYRDLAAMMAEREITVSHTTIIMRWVLRYVPEYERGWALRRATAGFVLAHGRNRRVRAGVAGDCQVKPLMI